MCSLEVKLLRKNRRWDLTDKNMFSSASIVDLTLLLTGKADPQEIHLQCTSDLKGTFVTSFGFMLNFDSYNMNYIVNILNIQK